LSVSIPQLPHVTVRVVFAAHAPWLVQGPGTHAQLDEQVSVSVPQLPQAIVRVAPVVQTPPPPPAHGPGTH
jgi:hypothetical protein